MATDDKISGQTEAAKTEAERRRERQAAALRENLRRRKARDRAGKSAPDSRDAPDDTGA